MARFPDRAATPLAVAASDGPGAAPSAFLRTQVAAEREALRLVAHAEVRAALEGLAAQWRDGTPGRLTETYAQLPASLEEVLFMVALEVVNDDARRPRVVEISAGPHHWHGLDVPGGRWGINNPDTLYFAVPIESGSRYVLHGHRGADGPVDLNVSVQVRDVWATLGNVGQRDLALDGGGRYRITVDDEPADGRRDHLQIRERGTVLVIRQTFGDWSRGVPDELSVERIAGPAPRPSRSDDEMARALIERMGDVVAHNVHTLQAPIFRQPANTLPQPGAAGEKSGYLVTQRSALGHFRLDDDDALVARFDPGGAGYAAFTATNVWGISPDPARHGNSLNNHQAVADADGTITLVVSNRDPGVVNWIDPAGLREGILMLRWQLLGEAPGGSAGPAIALERVKHHDLASALPAHAQRVNAVERRRQLDTRATAYARRFEHR